MLVTAQDISMKAGISLQAVLRKRFMGDYLVKEVSFGGRPKKMFRVEVLERFGIAVPSGGDKAIGKIEVEPHDIVKRGFEMEKTQRKRAQNSSTGKPRVISEELEALLRSKTLEAYLGQSKRDNILRCVQWVVDDYWDLISRETTKSKYRFVEYFYHKRLMRRSAAWCGPVGADVWKVAWDEKHNVSGFNAKLPTARWDYHKLFKEAGLVGEGFGAGIIWVVDGTQFDSFVDNNGKAETMNYMMILDGMTQMPLYFRLLEKGEKKADVAEIFWAAVKIHGKPKFGIVADNGSAFKSSEIKMLVKSWYTSAELDEMRANTLIRTIFDIDRGSGQEGPIWYPGARKPQYPFKAMLERKFRELNRHQSERLAASFIATRDSEKVSLEYGSTPEKAVKLRPRAEDAFNDFVAWVYTEDINRHQPKLRWLHKEGFDSTVLGIWQYMGGRFDFDGLVRDPEEAMRQLLFASRRELPEQAEYYYKFSTSQRHKVKPLRGTVSFQEGAEYYKFVCDELDVRLSERTVTAVLSKDKKKCYIFKEWDGYADKNNPDRKEVYFVGVGLSSAMESIKDIAKVRIASRRVAGKITEQTRAISRDTVGYDMEVKNKVLSAKEVEYELLSSRAAELPPAEARQIENTKTKDYDSLEDFL